MTPSSITDQEIIDQFHLLWYDRRKEETWRTKTSFLGAALQQCPTDLWVYQELIWATKPDVIVEVGIKRGGLTYYFANLLDLIHGATRPRLFGLGAKPTDGRIVAVDVSTALVDKRAKQHPRVTILEGSSVDPGVFERVRSLTGDGRVMVLLDSDHTAAHVMAELDLYSELVSPGCYLIVNDGNINGHPALPEFGPGPYEAVEEWLPGRDDFVLDKDAEKHMLTLCPNGFLKRVE
jgi:cephalosporin hydroxylase